MSSEWSLLCKAATFLLQPLRTPYITHLFKPATSLLQPMVTIIDGLHCCFVDIGWLGNPLESLTTNLSDPEKLCSSTPHPWLINYCQTDRQTDTHTHAHSCSRLRHNAFVCIRWWCPNLWLSIAFHWWLDSTQKRINYVRMLSFSLCVL